MSRRNKPGQPVSLQLIGNGTANPFIGVHEVPGRLPTMLRYPGEPTQAFMHRVLHQVRGTGKVVAMLMYRQENEVTH
jgi:hypothetical protein